VKGSKHLLPGACEVILELAIFVVEKKLTIIRGLTSWRGSEKKVIFQHSGAGGPSC
jgi:hypothetical protein